MTEKYNNRSVGTEYERKAADYLRTHGYEILEKNFRCRSGEIDLIGKDGEYLVFIEVKYRSSDRMGEPAEAVNYRKQRAIIRVAKFYMLKNQISEDTPCRFDVVVILENEITLLQDAFML